MPWTRSRRLSLLAGIGLTEADIQYWMDNLAVLGPECKPSMRQDAEAHRPTELALFAKTVRALGIERDMKQLYADIAAGKLKGLLLFGVDIPAEQAENMEFVLEADSTYGRAYPYASVLVPLAGFGAVTGSYVNFEGRLQKVEAAVQPAWKQENWQLLAELINNLNSRYKFTDLQQIRDGLAAVVPEFAAACSRTLFCERRRPATPTPDGVVLLHGRETAAFAKEYEQASTSMKNWSKMKH